MKEQLIAWILSLVLAASGTGCTPGSAPGSGNIDVFDSVYAMAAPDFPEMAAYPEPGDGSDYDPSAWDEWSAQKQKQWDAAASYDGKLDRYLQTALPALMKPQKGSENAVCSPVNVWFALAMAAETAGGDTRQELLDLLGVSSVEQLREIATALWTANYTDDGANTLRLGASLWMNQDYAFKEKTLQTLAKDYFAASFRGAMTDPAFSKAFKDWLNEMTGGLL